MKKLSAVVLCLSILLVGCNYKPSQEQKDSKAVEAQQSQYAKAQPIPAYDYSLERELVIKLYNLRNEKVSTHSVWRSNSGIVEGDCTSMGFGIPYDTSLTNPNQISAKRVGYSGNKHYADGTIGQAEPNGIFASTNTSATWVMCISKSGAIEPHYVESKVTVYPYQVNVNYKTNRVTRKNGSKSVSLN